MPRPWVELAAARHPILLAVEAPDGELTYQQLADAAAGGRSGLRNANVRAGARVALALPAGAQFAVALHACLLAGAAAVPIDLRLTPEERGRRLAGSEVVVSEPLAGAPSEGPAILPEPDPAVAVMHTSGTTAAPKPVVLRYSNWQASALGSADSLGLDPEERWLCPMPLTHVGGLSIPIRSAIYATSAIVHGRFDTEAVLRDLSDAGRRITLVSLVPTMLARLLDAGLERPATLRWALLGGGPIPPGLLERARQAGVPVAPSYGMTEACSQIATFGRPLTGVELRLAHGEVLVRGPIVAEAALSQDGWLHTGDLGGFDPEGRLVITGRKAETIVTGGENVSPSEVEAVLLEHPAVAEAGVFGRPDREWGEAVSAVVVLRDGVAADPQALREFCLARLAGFKVPKTIALAPELPRTPAGKLLRRQLGGLV